MDFKEFLGIYEAYKDYRDLEAGRTGTTPPAPKDQGARPADTMPPAQEGGSPTPDMMIAQMQSRIAAMEQKLLNPSMAEAKPKGLEDIFNRILGDPE